VGNKGFEVPFYPHSKVFLFHHGFKTKKLRGEDINGLGIPLRGAGYTSRDQGRG